MAKQIKVDGLCDGMDAMEVYTRLDRVRKIRDKDLVAITIDHELEDVVEIFSRLNSRGTRVTEADIYPWSRGGPKSRLGPRYVPSIPSVACRNGVRS